MGIFYASSRYLQSIAMKVAERMVPMPPKSKSALAPSVTVRDKKGSKFISIVSTAYDLANLSEDLSIPSAVYLSLPRPVTEFFSELIENEQFNQYILTDSKFKIVPLDEKIFVGNVRISKEATHDSALEMESLYISKYLNY